MSELFGEVGRKFRHSGIVAGLGASSGARASEILALIDECLAARGLGREAVAACVTITSRKHHPGLLGAAQALGLPLLTLDHAHLTQRTPNPSAKVVALAGLASVAEAAALRFGPLLVEKRRSARATCALSLYDASTANAASTLLTSGAG